MLQQILRREILLVSDDPEEFIALSRACERANSNLERIRSQKPIRMNREVPRDFGEALAIAKARVSCLPRVNGQAVISICNCLVADAEEPAYLIALVYLIYPQGGDQFFLSEAIPIEWTWLRKRIVLTNILFKAVDQL